MMCYILIFAASLCCASAALTVNAYDDSLKSLNNVDKVNSCDPSACNTLCRILGFKDGVCVAGGCECESKELSSEKPSSAETVDDCNYNACDQLCRRLGFPGGACVGDRCKCDNFKQSLGQEPSNSPVSVDDCNYNACDQLCRRLGFPGGVCVGDRCKCDNFKQSLVSLLNLGSCDWQQCDQRCRSYGLPGGSCDAGQCKCNTWPSDEENEIRGKPVANVAQVRVPFVEKQPKADVSMRSIVPRGSCDCDPRSCDRYCFRIHYIGGICVTGSCRCYK